MKRAARIFEELDDWEVLCTFLPKGWEQKARELGALKRARGIADAQALLRVLLIHIAGGCSLAETAVRAEHLGLGQMNGSAVYKRLRSAEEWLRWLAEQTRYQFGMMPPEADRKLRAVDATTICEPGQTGSLWRIHYSMDLRNLRCDFFQLTDVHGGESWQRFPVESGDILLGDRGYAKAPGIEHVLGAQADVVVRLNRNALPLWDKRGARIQPLKAARGLGPKQCGEWFAKVKLPSGSVAKGRLIIVRLSRQAALRARRQLQRQASKKQIRLNAARLEATQYVILWTSLPVSWSRIKVLNLYRCRWQIELAFKRMKSIMNAGHLPKKDPESCRAWLYGKLLTSLLVERLIAAAKNISPWGYELEPPSQPMA
jgi:hypothetical protein